MTQYTIKYTETFNNSMNIAIDHFSKWSAETDVIEKIEETLDTFEDAVKDSPFIYPVSQSIFDIAGISSVREANINGYRLLYEVDEDEKLVTGDILLGQKQSVREQLIKHCLRFR